MTRVAAFVRLTRPHFLLGGVLLYAVGAVQANEPQLGRYVLGQAVVTFAQVTAHYVNEYSDVEADRGVVNRTLFSGGSGVLTEGGLAPSVALGAAVVTSAATITLAVWLSVSSPVAAALGLLALGISWAYSMAPVRLLDTGWGELATSLVVAGLVPVIGLLVNGGRVTIEFTWLVAMLLVIHFAMMLAFALPDLETDRAAGKTVLAVRLGQESTQRVLVAAVVAVVALAAGGFVLSLTDGTGWVLAALLPAVVMAWAAFRDRPTLLTASAVASLVAMAAAGITLGTG